MSQLLSGQVKTAIIQHNSSGDNTIITAPSDGYIAIDHINFVPRAAVDVTLKSGASNAKSGVYQLAQQQPLTLENTTTQECGVITCENNEAFVINLGSGVRIDGFIRYRIVGNP